MISRRSLLTSALTALPASSFVLSRNQRHLVLYGDPQNKHPRADMVLATHARRDVTFAVPSSAELIVPADEAHLFTNPQAVWQNIYTTRRLHDYENQGTHFPLTAFPRVRPVKDGEIIQWQGLPIEVLSTPGFTRGAVSYSFRDKGQRIIATGDLIYAGGKLLDLYSLQDAIPDLKVRGYHGFASRIAQLNQSLRRILSLRPDVLIPAHGPRITNPQQQIELLLNRLAAVFANYLRTDAYRWYFGPENYAARARRILGDQPPQGLPYSQAIEKTLPPWLRAITNARLVISSSGEAILIDCGSQRIIDQLKTWQAEGVFKTLRAVYVTHYHDDHTDFAQAAANHFQAELWSSSEQSEILMHPERFRMPCLTPNPIPGLKPWRDLETRDWHEFQLQNFHFPGQTLYHGALLVTPKSPNASRVLFVGDSFTPSGVDDYCLLNRNLLHPRQGLLYCLSILESMPDAFLVNQHVEPLFRFSPAQLTQLRQSLEARIPLLADLFPFDNPNYGIDEQWFRLSPYVQKVKSGQPFTIEATVLNHSPRDQRFRIHLHGPTKSPHATLTVKSGEESKLQFACQAPANRTGLTPISASIAFADWNLPHWAEALVELLP
jgi:glyoxylase-like metal-dependent hydrolase (beta-lactamase superfamily II)